MSKDPIHLENRDEEGLRLFSPTAGRNSGPIGDILSESLPENASVFEVGSGTGEHAVHNCLRRPDISWQPSDPDERSRQSQNAWASECHGRIRPSLDIDSTLPKWWVGLPRFNALFSANMIHIAPWEAALGLAKGAPHILEKDAKIYIYGPFKEGKDTAESNLNFDLSLKSRNPAWGVRELDSVKHIFADAGFNLTARIVMPKENRILIFSNTA